MTYLLLDDNFVEKGNPSQSKPIFSVLNYRWPDLIIKYIYIYIHTSCTRQKYDKCNLEIEHMLRAAVVIVSVDGKRAELLLH